MKRVDSDFPIRLACALGFLLPVILCAGCGVPYAAATGPAADEALTVNQTLGLVFGSSKQPDYHLIRRANPASIGTVRKVLDDPELERFHTTAWRVLGQIGDANDLANLERRLRSFKGVLDGYRSDTSFAMFDAIGLMCGRGIETACTLVDRMQKPDYWDEMNFRFIDPAAPQPISFAYDSIIRLMFGYGLSRRSDMGGRIERIRDGIADPETREKFELAMSKEVLMNHTTELFAYQENAFRDNRLETFFDGDPQHPGPAIDKSESDRIDISNRTSPSFHFSEQISGDEAKRITSEAAKSYGEITGAVLRGDSDFALDRLLDDGKPITMRERANQVEMFKGIAQTKALLMKVRSVATQNGAPRVERRREVMPDGREVTTTLVTHEVLGTKDLDPRIRSRSGPMATVAENGNLIVVMKNINGKWYWNPFGW